MKTNKMKKLSVGYTLLLPILFVACSPGNQKSINVEKEIDGFEQGTYGYDVAFFKENSIETIELKNENTGAQLLLAPGYQGRVMTSSASSDSGTSFGWINYDLIQSGKVDSQFNPVGGEERFWLGPEGGPYSIYFREGDEQIYENWKVPPIIDTESFEIKKKEIDHIIFTKNAELKNASGTRFKFAIDRTISLLSEDTLSTLFNVDFLSNNYNVVGYQSVNKITNTGDNSWTKEGGLLSIWILSMFNPSPTTTVFVPYKTNEQGTVVNDDYFGKVPADRLIVDNGIVYFKIDGKYRSKIGLPPERATGICGSYDSEKKILTIVWGSLPANGKDYVNSKWGEQDNPYAGDAINAYNDGPVEDGSVMGPFYEIETSSPGAQLEPGESLTHIQRVVHVQGEPNEMDKLVVELFDVSIQSIVAKFK